MLEYGLKLLLWTLSFLGAEGLPLAAATEIVEGRDKKTMGQLLHLLRQRGRFDDESERTLLAALEARNAFTHHFLSDNTEAIADPDRRHAVVAEVNALRKTILAGNAIVGEFIGALLRVQGIDPEQLQAQFDDEIRAMNSKVSS